MADVAYRELTQHFPRPGWVEHDAAEIWDAVRATLAEVGARLAERATPSPPSASPTSARRSWRSTVRRDGRCTAPSSGRTAARRPCAPSSPRPATSPSCAPPPGSCSTPTSAPPRRPGCSATATSRSPPTIRTSPSARSTAGCCGTSPAAPAAAPTPPTLPTPAAPSCSIRPRSPGPPSSVPLFGVPPHTLPEVRPSAGRFGTASLGDLGPAAAVLDGVPVSGVLGDQQAALFGQACFEPGMVKVTYGTGSFALANAGPERPPAPDGLTVSCAWDLGPHADAPTAASPTRSRARPSSRAPPSSGCATGSASSPRPPRSAPSRHRCPIAAASPSSPR